jgi:hypothetical protein
MMRPTVSYRLRRLQREALMTTKSDKAPGSKSPKRQSRREKDAVKAKAKKLRFAKRFPYYVGFDWIARIEL